MKSFTIAEAILSAAEAKEWAHDRGNTIGASEMGQCARRVWFLKNDAPTDDGHVERRGAMDRGDLIERYYWAPRLHVGLANTPSLVLRHHGDSQRSLVSGYVSATPDGVVVNVMGEPVAFEGVEIPPGGCVLVECKSIDPRVNLDEAKAEHRFQAQMQLGLVKECTNYQPIACIISYVNASFLDDIKTFIVPADAAVYEAGKKRALQIMTAKLPADLRPEGQIAGGKECDTCPWEGRCRGASAAAVPKKEAALPDRLVDEFERAAEEYLHWTHSAAAVEEGKRKAQDRLKQILQDGGTRKAKTASFNASWASVAGKSSIDFAAMKADGIDLEKYQIAGHPHDRLTVSRVKPATTRQGANSEANSEEKDQAA